MAYLVDANVFINAKNQFYGFDFCPGFWEWLELQNKSGNVFSIDKVGDELQGRDDQLARWAKARGSSFFLPLDEAVLPALQKVAEWVRGQRYRPMAFTNFLGTADYYLIAYALAHGHTVVSHEVASNAVKEVKIPDVCIGLGMNFDIVYAMLRKERARFVLAK